MSCAATGVSQVLSAPPPGNNYWTEASKFVVGD